jgi:hypothetical protein
MRVGNHTKIHEPEMPCSARADMLNSSHLGTMTGNQLPDACLLVAGAARSEQLSARHEGEVESSFDVQYGDHDGSDGIYPSQVDPGHCILSCPGDGQCQSNPERTEDICTVVRRSGQQTD